MLCDEVLSALDVSVQASILELLRTLQAEHQLAYLFISHDLAVVRSLAQHVGVLYRGEMVESGAVEEVYLPPYHPYTAMLLKAAPEIEREGAALAQMRTEPIAPIILRDAACPLADRCPVKIGEICEDVPPLWHQVSPTHALRCHLPLEELRKLELPQFQGPLIQIPKNHS